MPRIDPRVVYHKFALYHGAEPVAQEKRKLVGENQLAVREET